MSPVTAATFVQLQQRLRIHRGPHHRDKSFDAWILFTLILQ